MLKQYTIADKLMTLADYIEYEMKDFDIVSYTKCFCGAWNRKMRLAEGHSLTLIPNMFGLNSCQSMTNLIAPKVVDQSIVDHHNRYNNILAAKTLRRFAAGEFIERNWIDGDEKA